MFTGIVQTMGEVAGVERQPSGVRLAIATGGWQPAGGPPLRLGDSVCVSGVCLTVAGLDPGRLAFDVIAETLARSTLGELTAGAKVNLEPSLTPTTPMGGHFVQGHVDGVGRITRVQAGEDWRITVRPPEGLMDYIVPKGSIAISGVSLTVAAVRRAEFEVALIPTTLELTTLGEARPGQHVNLETDIVSRTVVYWLQRQAQLGAGTAEALPEGLTMEQPREGGFVRE